MWRGGEQRRERQSLPNKADCVWERKAKESGLSWLSARKPRVLVPSGEVCIIVGGGGVGDRVGDMGGGKNGARLWRDHM